MLPFDTDRMTMEVYLVSKGVKTATELSKLQKNELVAIYNLHMALTTGENIKERT
jgi:hypothetical protein